MDLGKEQVIAPTIVVSTKKLLPRVGLLPETEYGEIANLVGVFGTSLIGGIRYANAATRAAQNQNSRDTIADVAAVRGVSPASVRQVDDLVGAKEIISRGASPITGLGTTSKKGSYWNQYSPDDYASGKTWSIKDRTEATCRRRLQGKSRQSTCNVRLSCRRRFYDGS